MDRDARDQYLRDLREEYVLAARKVKTKLLEEAVKRTRLHRKVVIRKLARPRTLVAAPRQKRQRRYDAAVQAALVELWKLFESLRAAFRALVKRAGPTLATTATVELLAGGGR